MLIRGPDWGLLKGFLANNKANVTPRLECSVIRGCEKAVFLVFMKVPPQERGFNCFWKFIIVWLLCCEIVVSLIMAKWNLELQLFAVLCAEEKYKGKFSWWYLPAHFHMPHQHPASSRREANQWIWQIRVRNYTKSLLCLKATTCSCFVNKPPK